MNLLPKSSKPPTGKILQRLLEKNDIAENIIPHLNKKRNPVHTRFENILEAVGPAPDGFSDFQKGMIICMNWIDRIALLLVIVGGINWGSVGLFQYDLVGALFGGMSGIISRIIFTLVGIAALWCISLLFRSSDRS